VSGNASQTSGGGIAHAQADNCLIVSNTAGLGGGGVFSGGLTNCTVVGNAAQTGGGVSDSLLANCIVYFNTAPSGPNYYSANLPTLMNFCCTSPLPETGTANVAADPGFAELLTGDFHLQPLSPCRNAGDNSQVSGSTDLDGAPRIISGTVDLGAFETPP